MPRRCFPLLFVGLAGFLTACAPTFNWRSQAIGATGLSAMFPCKPEAVTRNVPIAGAEHAVALRSCDAGGVTFALAHARLGDPAQAPTVLAAWRASTLAGLQAAPLSVTSQTPPGLPALPQLLVLHATGAPPGRASTTLIGVWFAQGADAFAAFVMAPDLPHDVTEPFFSGLRLR